MTTWTKEPPTFNHEGRVLPDARPYWWFRYPLNRGGPWAILRDPINPNLWCWHGNDCEYTTQELVNDGGEWWPIPIQPPPTEQEKP